MSKRNNPRYTCRICGQTVKDGHRRNGLPVPCSNPAVNVRAEFEETQKARAPWLVKLWRKIKSR